MMKFKIFSLLLIMLVIFMSGCQKNTSNKGSAVSDKSVSNPSNINNDTEKDPALASQFSDFNIVEKKEKNFEIQTNDNRSAFVYYIHDDNGYLMDIGYHDARGSFDVFYEGNLVVLDYGAGGNSWHERYYDTAEGKVSRLFEQPVAHTKEKVAYYDFNKGDEKPILIIQDIFDKKIFYKEIERDFSDDVFKVKQEGMFIDSGTKLKIKYKTNSDEKYVEEIINLD